MLRVRRAAGQTPLAASCAPPMLVRYCCASCCFHCWHHFSRAGQSRSAQSVVRSRVSGSELNRARIIIDDYETLGERLLELRAHGSLRSVQLWLHQLDEEAGGSETGHWPAVPAIQSKVTVT